MLLPMILLAAQATPPPARTDCVPHAGEQSYTFDRPPLGEIGDPVTAEWETDDQGAATGNPELIEHDPLNRDDAMGDGTPTPDGAQAAGTVYNTPPSLLHGANGEVQNMGLEGRCIEIKMCWKYRYRAILYHAGKSYAGKPASGGIAEVVWRRGRQCSEKKKKICPC